MYFFSIFFITSLFSHFVNSILPSLLLKDFNFLIILLYCIKNVRELNLDLKMSSELFTIAYSYKINIHRKLQIFPLRGNFGGRCYQIMTAFQNRKATTWKES